jgi:DNA-directed RNA polymerase specialized sigma24 family protein
MTIAISNIAHAFREDREQVFQNLYATCYPKVKQMVFALGGDEEAARDTFQDALIIFYEQSLAGKLAIEHTPAAYIKGIAKHLWRRKRGQDNHLLSFSAFEETLALPLDWQQPLPKPKLRLFKFLAAAGRKCLDLLQAFYYQQMPLRKIAEEFGFQNTRSATVQKHKCLEKIRSEVQQKQLSYEEVVA